MESSATRRLPSCQCWEHHAIARSKSPASSFNRGTCAGPDRSNYFLPKLLDEGVRRLRARAIPASSSLSIRRRSSIGRPRNSRVVALPRRRREPAPRGPGQLEGFPRGPPDARHRGRVAPRVATGRRLEERRVRRDLVAADCRRRSARDRQESRGRPASARLGETKTAGFRGVGISGAVLSKNVTKPGRTMPLGPGILEPGRLGRLFLAGALALLGFLGWWRRRCRLLIDHRGRGGLFLARHP